MKPDRPLETEGKSRKISGDKLLAGAIYVATALCIIGFIGQSIASILSAH